MRVLEIAKINNMPITTGEGWTLDQLETLEREAFERDMETEEIIDMEGYGPSGHPANEDFYDFELDEGDEYRSSKHWEGDEV